MSLPGNIPYSLTEAAAGKDEQYQFYHHHCSKPKALPAAEAAALAGKAPLSGIELGKVGCQCNAGMYCCMNCYVPPCRSLNSIVYSCTILTALNSKLMATFCLETLERRQPGGLAITDWQSRALGAGQPQSNTKDSGTSAECKDATTIQPFLQSKEKNASVQSYEAFLQTILSYSLLLHSS
jgi:hypothetical protein